MHNKENVRFIQIHAAAVRVERPALSLSLRFINLSCLWSAVSAARRALSVLSIVVAFVFLILRWFWCSSRSKVSRSARVFRFFIYFYFIYYFFFLLRVDIYYLENQPEYKDRQ